MVHNAYCMFYAVYWYTTRIFLVSILEMLRKCMVMYYIHCGLVEQHN